MAQAKVTDVSSLSGLEKFVETFKKEFPKTKSKVKIYLSELKDCFTKEESEAKFKKGCEKLYNAFPTDRQRYVKNYLKNQVFQEREVARKKITDETTGKEVLTNMASQGSTVYSLEALDKELVDITPYSIQTFSAKLKDCLEKGDEKAVRTTAKALQDEIDRKGNRTISDGGKAFLKQLQDVGNLCENSSNLKPGVTIVPVGQSLQNTEKAKIHQPSKASDQEKIEEMFQSGNRPEGSRQPAGSQTMKHKAPDPPQQSSMSATFTSASSVKQLIAVDKESDPVTEVLKLIQGSVSSNSGDVPKALQSQPIALELIRGIKKLQEDINNITDENKRLSEQNDNRILSLEEKLEATQKTFQRLEKEKKDVEDVYNKSCMEHATEKADMELKYNDYIEREDQLNVQLQSDLKQLQKSKDMVEDKLRKTTKENAELLEQFQQHAEDNARQKQKLSEELHRLHKDNKELKSRVSELAGAKLMDNNPDIADLSDPNRALKLGEKFSSLYDDDWTDAYQTFTEKFNMKEDEAIQFLLHVLLKIYDFCRRVADEQMDCLCNVFENPCQDIPKALTMKPQKEKAQITQKQFKDLKDLRKQIGMRKTDNIIKQYVSKEYEEIKKGDKKLKSMLDETKSYYEKCVEVCWPMVLHDPPVKMEYPIKPGIKIDGNRFRLYGGNGDVLENLVWPPLLVEGGGLLAKGVAKPKKTPRTVKKP